MRPGIRDINRLNLKSRDIRRRELAGVVLETRIRLSRLKPTRTKLPLIAGMARDIPSLLLARIMFSVLLFGGNRGVSISPIQY
jgi:hypothetical protein